MEIIDLGSVKVDLSEIAEAIHDGWYQMMVNKGYTFGSERDDEKKSHPHLIAWNDMLESDKESSYASAEAVAQLLIDIRLEYLSFVTLGEQ